MFAKKSIFVKNHGKYVKGTTTKPHHTIINYYKYHIQVIDISLELSGCWVVNGRETRICMVASTLQDSSGLAFIVRLEAILMTLISVTTLMILSKSLNYQAMHLLELPTSDTLFVI
jgi:hypothetical protein